MTDLSDYLTTVQVAELLGVKPNTVHAEHGARLPCSSQSRVLPGAGSGGAGPPAVAADHHRGVPEQQDEAAA
jgi:hypothetical protein